MKFFFSFCAFLLSLRLANDFKAQKWNAETNTITVPVSNVAGNSVKSVTVSSYKDIAGNEGLPFTKNVTFSEIVPAITSTEVVKDGGTMYANLMFNTNMTASDLTNVKLSGQLRTPDNVVKNVDIQAKENLHVDAVNKKLVKLNVNTLEAGTYNLTLPKEAFSLNNDLAVTFTINPTVNNTTPNVDGTPVITNKTVTVKYDQEMGQSALDVNNYMVDDTIVFANAFFKGDTKTVELTLKDDAIQTDGNRKLNISTNVKGLNGMALPAYSSILSFKENVRPVISSAKFEGDTKIVLTFSEAVKSAQVNAGIDVLVNGRKSLNTIATTVNGSTQITLTKNDGQPFVAPGDYNAATVTVEPAGNNTVTDMTGNSLKTQSITVTK